MAGAVQQVVTGDYAMAAGGKYLASIQGDAETEIDGRQSSRVAGNIDIETRGALTEKIAALRRSVAAGQQVIGQTVHIGTEQTNALTMLLDTIDLLAELASQCASHTPGTGAPVQSGAFTRTATKAGTTRENTPLSLPE
jgi:hypothetical protein